MRKLGDLLKRHRNLRDSVGEVDAKIIEKAFFDVLKKEFSNIAQADIQSFKLNDKKIFIRTVHPAIASEIWRKREKLKSEINKLLEGKFIEDIRAK